MAERFTQAQVAAKLEDSFVENIVLGALAFDDFVLGQQKSG